MVKKGLRAKESDSELNTKYSWETKSGIGIWSSGIGSLELKISSGSRRKVMQR